MFEFSGHVVHEFIIKVIIKVPLQNWSLKTEVNQAFDTFEMLKNVGVLSAIWGVVFCCLDSSYIITQNLFLKKILKNEKKEGEIISNCLVTTQD